MYVCVSVRARRLLATRVAEVELRLTAQPYSFSGHGIQMTDHTGDSIYILHVYIYIYIMHVMYNMLYHIRIIFI